MNKDGFINKPDNWNNFNFVYNSLYDKKIDNIKLLTKNNVFFILAGGFNQDGLINEWVKRRLDKFIDIYNNNKDKIDYVVCLGGGTYHRPPVLNKDNFVIHESTGLVKYLLDNGIDKNIIMREWFSYDTIANGYFSLINFSKIRNWKNIYVITSDFHLERSRFIFNWIYSLDNKEYNLNYIGVTDKGLDEEIITMRKEREKKSLENLKKLNKKIKNLEEFHIWFHNEHNCYNCNFKREEVDEKTKKTY